MRAPSAGNCSLHGRKDMKKLSGGPLRNGRSGAKATPGGQDTPFAILPLA